MLTSGDAPDKYTFEADEITQIIVSRMTPRAHFELDGVLLQKYASLTGKDRRYKVTLWEFDEQELEDWNAPTSVTLLAESIVGNAIRLAMVVSFNDRVTWKKSSLFIHGQQLPATTIAHIKDREIEEVVAGTPFGHFTISSVGTKKQKGGKIDTVLRTHRGQFKPLLINGQKWQLRKTITK